MNKDDIYIFEKFKKVIDSNFNEKEAVTFLSQLSTDEYNRLIHIFGSDEFSKIDKETKQKILIVFKKLRDELMEV